MLRNTDVLCKSYVNVPEPKGFLREAIKEKPLKPVGTGQNDFSWQESCRSTSRKLTHTHMQDRQLLSILVTPRGVHIWPCPITKL